MNFSSQRYADVCVAVPAGRIDHTSADAFQRAVEPVLAAAATAGGPIVLDLAGVDYISSVGLRVVMVAAKQTRGRGSRIAATALTPLVREIFEIARFSHVVEVFATTRDALQALSAPALAAYEASPPPGAA